MCATQLVRASAAAALDAGAAAARAQKARHRFPHTPATKKTVTGIPQIIVFAPVPP